MGGENTHGLHFGLACPGNYLRVRGEYRRSLPATWHPLGTTSACAENTAIGGVGARAGWNYLRVRGEYMLMLSGVIVYRVMGVVIYNT